MLAEAVFAALFGLGRLQPLIDDPLVENIDVDGFDQVWISYADGRLESGPPVADSDADLVETLQSYAAYTAGRRAGSSPPPGRCCICGCRTAAASPPGRACRPGRG